MALVEIDAASGDSFVIALDEPLFRLHWWTSSAGYTELPVSQRWLRMHEALSAASYADIAALWSMLTPHPMPPPWERAQICGLLYERLCDRPGAEFVVTLFRPYRGACYVEPVKVEQRDPSAPLATEHYLAVQALDRAGRPVAGVALELLLTGGELRTTRTGTDGFARLERLRAASATIRVVSHDGSLWAPAEGEPARCSGGDQRVRWHSVRQGECLSAIAHQYGLPNWKDVWQHPQNAPLRKKRKSPHVLLPGDDVAVPSLEIREFVRPTDATHQIVVASEPMSKLKLHLLDNQRKPVAEGSYELWAKDELIAEGRIQDGKVECELALRVQDADLVARVDGKTVRRRLRLAALDPLDATSGLQARLSNLGYFEDEVDGQESESLSQAVREFRRDAGLDGDAQVDAALRDALEREHRV